MFIASTVQVFPDLDTELWPTRSCTVRKSHVPMRWFYTKHQRQSTPRQAPRLLKGYLRGVVQPRILAREMLRVLEYRCRAATRLGRRRTVDERPGAESALGPNSIRATLPETPEPVLWGTACFVSIAERVRLRLQLLTFLFSSLAYLLACSLLLLQPPPLLLFYHSPLYHDIAAAISHLVSAAAHPI